MCKTKQDKLAGNRLSADRIIDIFGEAGTKIPGMILSDFRLPFDFATNGITPIVTGDFLPERINIPPLRARYVTLKHTINSLLFERLGKGTKIIMETEQAKTVKGVHFSPKENQKAETCRDSMIHLSLPSMEPLKAMLCELIATTWGEIRHPSIVQLVLMILHAADTHGWKEMVLWKKDLKGAFNLLNYNPAYCRLFAFPLSDDITMIHLAGLFGLIGMPHAFQVLTRSLQALCSYIISGWYSWYVDDLMAVSSISTCVTDSAQVESTAPRKFHPHLNN